MSAFRQVYCAFCRQRFMTPSLDEQCSLCCKRGGLIDESDPAAAQRIAAAAAAQAPPSPASAAPAFYRRASEIRFSPAPARFAARPFQLPPPLAGYVEGLGQPLARFA